MQTPARSQPRTTRVVGKNKGMACDNGCAELRDQSRSEGNAVTLDIEYMTTREYKQSWCGSVLQTRPKSPKLAAFTEDTSGQS